MRNLKRKGFTLVELVIVIAVIAVLAAVLIPTFSNLIKKANESVDIQLVRQMNTILKNEEIIDGKPINITSVKNILAKNGFNDPVPALSTSAFAWDSEENVIILLSKETQKGVFPDEYKDVDYDAETWIIFGGTVNVNMEDLGATFEEALNNVEFGQTIVISEDCTTTSAINLDSVSIDLGGHKLTLSNASIAENANIVISNGEVTSGYIAMNTGATLTLNDVNWTTSGGGCAIGIPKHGATVNINGGTFIADEIIGTAYSLNAARAAKINVSNAQFGTQENPCERGIVMITSGTVTVTNCVIYATEAALVNRAGNMIVENTTINYAPTTNFVDTYAYSGGAAGGIYEGVTPGDTRQYSWTSYHGGFKAPIVVGDFWAEEYSFDANCTLINVTVNSTNDTYPDVYLSQEGYDIVPWGAGKNEYNNNTLDWNNLLTTTNPKTEKTVLKTNLTCDNTITWMVNPGKNDGFVANATGSREPFKNYSGFQFSNSGYGGVALLYVDNVFVNGVEQAAGSTSANYTK